MRNADWGRKHKIYVKILNFKWEYEQRLCVVVFDFEIIPSSSSEALIGRGGLSVVPFQLMYARGRLWDPGLASEFFSFHMPGVVSSKYMPDHDPSKYMPDHDFSFYVIVVVFGGGRGGRAPDSSSSSQQQMTMTIDDRRSSSSSSFFVVVGVHHKDFPDSHNF